MSWRNLMTPLYEKYFPSDSCSSSMAQSNMGKGSLLKSKDTFQGSCYNDKLQDLHNQMNKLKNDLSRYSGKENNSRLLNGKNSKQRQRICSDNLILRESNLKTPPKIKEEDSRDEYKENDEIYSGSSSKNISSPLQIVVEDMTKRNLMNENALYDSCDTNLAHNEMIPPEQIYEKETTRYPTNKRDKRHMKNYSTMNKKCSGELCDQNKLKTVRFSNLSVKIDKKVKEEDDEKDLTKAMVVDCCMQINELKQVARESQEQIFFLTEKLGREKKQSKDLREHLQRNSNSSADQNLTEPCHSNTPKNEKERCRPRLTSPQVQQGILQPRQRTPNTQMQVSNSFTDWRNKRQKDESRFTTFLDTTKERGEDESTKDFSSLKQGFRESGIQCDISVRRNADVAEYEKRLAEKDHEILNLKSELETMKRQKNDMIETFEKIVGLLNSEDKEKKPNKASENKEIKNSFSNFYKTIQNKMNDIHSIQQILPSNLQSSKLRLSSSNLFGASRNNRTEITDNLVYSPSNTRYSFDEELLESKHHFSIMPYRVISPSLKANSSQSLLKKLISPKNVSK